MWTKKKNDLASRRKLFPTIQNKMVILPAVWTLCIKGKISYVTRIEPILRNISIIAQLTTGKTTLVMGCYSRLIPPPNQQLLNACWTKRPWARTWYHHSLQEYCHPIIDPSSQQNVKITLLTTPDMRFRREGETVITCRRVQCRWRAEGPMLNSFLLKKALSVSSGCGMINKVTVKTLTPAKRSTKLSFFSSTGATDEQRTSQYLFQCSHRRPGDTQLGLTAATVWNHSSLHSLPKSW